MIPWYWLIITTIAGFFVGINTGWLVGYKEGFDRAAMVANRVIDNYAEQRGKSHHPKGDGTAIMSLEHHREAHRREWW